MAYVENLKPRRQSNFSTARIRPERALLDEVEEREPLVAVVLRDRDDEPQVGLDHQLLRLGVATLDPLCELHLLRGREQAVTPASRRKSCRASVVVSGGGVGAEGGSTTASTHLDAALVELAQQRLVLERRELVRVHDLGDLGRADRARLLAALEQLPQLLEREDAVDVDGRHQGKLVPRVTGTLPPSGPAIARPRRVSMADSGVSEASLHASVPAHDNQRYVK